MFGHGGRAENCQIGVFLAYASQHGHALIDRELYLLESWTGDRDRCRDAGIPDEVEFATKPRQVIVMLERALAAGVPFAWFTADEAYGQARYLRVWLEDRGVHYVMATRCGDQVTTRADRTERADILIAELPASSWQRLSVGAGPHGHASTTGGAARSTDRGSTGARALAFARRSISDSTEIAYYVYYGPHAARLVDPAWTPGCRWHIEEAFQQAKARPGSTTTRSTPGGPGTPTSPSQCLSWPGWPRREQLPQKEARPIRRRHDRSDIMLRIKGIADISCEALRKILKISASHGRPPKSGKRAEIRSSPPR
ncbi:IS701 family transposase [Nocardia terpenica]